MGLVVLRSSAWRARRLLVLGVVLALGVFGLGAVEAHAATPASLTGETFTATSGSLSVNCPSNSGVTNFSVSGTATGPYPGTFTESGSYTSPSPGANAAFSSSFTITSPSGSVSVRGTKSGSLGGSQCIREGNSFADLDTSYTATIVGVFRDSGQAGVNLIGTSGSLTSFSESFGNSNGVTYIGPTSEEQCKNGGWQNFGGAFKNQGDCVSYVASGGQNPPGGS